MTAFRWVTIPVLLIALLVSTGLAASAEPLEIRLLISGLDRETRATWEAIAEEYSQINPDRRIRLESLPTGGELYAGITAQFLSGDPGDIMQNWPQRGNTVDLVEGTIVVLDEFLDHPNPYTGKTWGEGFYPGIISANRAPSGEYMVFQIHTGRSGVFVYNRDLFAELGLDTPGTWVEFIGMLEALQAAGKTPIAISDEFGTWDSLHRMILSQLWWDWVLEADTNDDGTVSLEEATRAFLGGVVCLDDPRFDTIFRLHKQVYDYAMDGWTAATADDVYRTFVEGNTGIMFGGIANLRTLYQDELLDFEVAVFDFPTITEETAPHGSGRVFNLGAFGASLSVSSHARDKGMLDEVMDVAFFLQSPEVVNLFATDFWRLPAGPGYDLPAPLDGFEDPDPSYQAAYGQLSNWYWGDSAFMDFVYKNHQLYLRDIFSLEELKDMIEPMFMSAYRRIAAENNWIID